MIMQQQFTAIIRREYQEFRIQKSTMVNSIQYQHSAELWYVL